MHLPLVNNYSTHECYKIYFQAFTTCQNYLQVLPDSSTWEQHSSYVWNLLRHTGKHAFFVNLDAGYTVHNLSTTVGIMVVSKKG